MARRGLLLVDFKLEFGRARGRLYLGDEISPDTCRLWDARTRTKLDKDRFRQDLGGVEDAYQEVFRRLVEGAVTRTRGCAYSSGSSRVSSTFRARPSNVR